MRKFLLSLIAVALLAVVAAPAEAHGPRVVRFVQPRQAIVVHQPQAIVVQQRAFVAPAFVQPSQSIRFGPFGRVRQVNF